MNTAKKLIEKLKSKKAKIAVIGLGYVGLPLAIEKAKDGFTVIGIDRNIDRVNKVNRGICYIPDVVEEGMDKLVKKGRLKAVNNFRVLRNVDAICICVPTPLDENKDPDISYIKYVTKEIAKYLRKGQLVSLESTTYPGTTEEIVLPALQKSGLKVGRDFFLCFSPERVDPGNKTFKLKNTPKIVGGVTPVCGIVAKTLYGQIIDNVKVVSSPKVAEMEKLLENIFRSVNIALVNEIAILCKKMGIDVWEVVDAASTKPYGFMPFYPGPGIGGHCLSKDEVIFIKDNDNNIQTVKIGEFVGDLDNKYSVLNHKLKDISLFKPCNVQALSYDMKNNSFEYKDIQLMSKRAYNGEMRLIHTEDGRKISVTDKHPMLIYDTKNGLMIKMAKDIQKGDRLPINLSLPEENGLYQHKIDLIEYFKQNREKSGGLRIKFLDINLKKNKEILYPFLRKYSKNYNYKDFFLSNSLPFSAFIDIENANVIPINRESLLLCTGRGPSYNNIKAIIVLNEDFMRLLGYYLSEGCITIEKKTIRTRFTFNRKEQYIIKDLENILDKIKIKYSVYKSKVYQADCLKVSSKVFGILIKDILKCGNDSYSMKIPSICFNTPSSYRSALLSGILRGDAGVNHSRGKMSYIKNNKHYNSRYNTASIEYFTISPILYQQVIVLAQSLGFIPSFKKDGKTVRFYGYEQLKEMKPLFLGDKKNKIDDYIAYNEKVLKNKTFKRHGSFASVGVKEITSKQGEEVYSMEIADTNTFITSYGIITHNCIPLDPIYLAWKAKKYDFRTEFIELAAKINEAMPEYVVRLVVDGLNKRGKSIKDSKILVLGAAYKKDINDWRESPSLKIIELLKKQNARVFYNDPYIPSVKIKDKIWKSTKLSKEIIKKADCVLIATDHSCYNYADIVKDAKLIVDARGATRKFKMEDKIIML